MSTKPCCSVATVEKLLCSTLKVTWSLRRQTPESSKLTRDVAELFPFDPLCLAANETMSGRVLMGLQLLLSNKRCELPRTENHGLIERLKRTAIRQVHEIKARGVLG